MSYEITIDIPVTKFPCPQDSINQNAPSLGMTLRDYFAAQTQPEGELGITAAEAITGLKAPDYDKYKDKADFWVESIGFWAIAHAKYKYMQADAMLKARET